MRAYVDADNCIGCGVCEACCMEVFLMEDGLALVVADTTEENMEAVQDAINSCPVGAIREEE